MKIRSIKNGLAYLIMAVLLGLGQKCIVSAQSTCGLSFTGPNGNVLTSYIEIYPNYPNSDAYFHTLVQDPNEPVPMGTYKTWCVDAGTYIDPSQGYTVAGTYYTGDIFPTCDTNLNNELPANHPLSCYVTPDVWHEVNYILNHKNGAYFWDVQVAINDLVGGPPQGPSPPYPPFSSAIVNSLLADASNNATSWTPQCGDVIGAVYNIQYDGSLLLTNPVQLLMLEVPYCPVSFTNCPPDVYLGCNPPLSSIPDVQNPVNPTNAGAASCCGHPVTVTCTKSESTSGCSTFRILTFTASDGYGNTATCTQTISWTTDTNAPVIISAPTNTDLGCNPDQSMLPTDTGIRALVAVADDCSVVSTNVTHVDGGTPCAMTRTFTISATDGCGNTSPTQSVVYTWTVDTNAPVVTGVPTNTDLGCNPASLPTDASIMAMVSVSDNCSVQSTNVSHVDGGTPCAMTRTFTVTATDGCGNTSVPQSVTYTWHVDNTAPIITSAPTNADLGCNPATLPTDTDIQAHVMASDDCTVESINVSHVDSGTPCAMIRTFTIIAKDACDNASLPKMVIYTWHVDTTPPVLVSVPTNTDLGCNPDVASLPTDASVKAQVVAMDDCALQSINVSHVDTTNECFVSRTFTIYAVDACGNASTNQTVTYTWTSDTTPPQIICPPDITLSNFTAAPYCTYTPGEYGSWCNGTNASSILTNCFWKVYSGGYVQCGITNYKGYCLKFTSCGNVQKFVNCGGTPGCLKGSYSNPTSCEAGSFAGQALCLKLNVDFGDCKSKTGFSGGCGDLILNDPTCSFNGKKVRDILNICNTALGGGDISQWGCKISDLTVLCSNLNQSFDCGKPSQWCQSHLIPPAITNVSPAVTGYAVVIDKCTSTPTLTYTDSITAGACAGTYVIQRTWTAVDGCGNSNYCTQNIFLGNPDASVCGNVFLDCNGDGFLTPGIDSGLTNIQVILMDSHKVAIATNTTDSQGSYCFYNLAPGTYTVTVVSPSGYVQSAGTHCDHWLDSGGNQCWVDNDGCQHWKGGDGVDCWNGKDGCQHWKNYWGQDCWKDKYGYQHSQSCTYTSCDVPKGNSETFTLAACQNLSCVNFAYYGNAPKTTVCVTGPSYGCWWQPTTYTCSVTNTGTACFTSCQVSVCGKSYSCPPLSPGQGCSFPVSCQYNYGSYGWYNCQATATCYYSGSFSPCTAQSSCGTYLHW